MKQSIVRKIAILMCAVMLFCSLPLNIGVYAANDTNTGVTATEIEKLDKDEEIVPEQKKDITEVLKELIEAVKKVVVAIGDYLEAQEQAEQEQVQPEPVKPDNKDDEKDLSEAGVAGYLYDSKEKCFYTASDPWQRIVGYNELFDVFSEVALIDFDTVRFKFDYKNKNWLIQIWKGQYGLLFYGAEIGVYNKPKDRKIAHYDSVGDSDRLKMSMDFYEYKKSLFTKGEWEKQFSRPYEYYWWCTGFIPGNRDGDFDKLRVDARITAKDYDMLSGLTKAIEKQGMDYKVKGLDVVFTYQ